MTVLSFNPRPVCVGFKRQIESVYIFRTQGLWCSQDLELFMIETAAYHRTVSEYLHLFTVFVNLRGIQGFTGRAESFFSGTTGQHFVCSWEPAQGFSSLQINLKLFTQNGLRPPNGMIFVSPRLQSTFWMLAFYEDHPSWRNIVACWGFQWLLVWIWQLPYKTI